MSANGHTNGVHRSAATRPAPSAARVPVPWEGAYDVVVVGGGVIGLAVAWRAAGRGLRVAVADPAPGSGATHAAAGMLAPVSEVTYGEEPLLALSLASAARYPAFIAEVEAGTGVSTGFRTSGTLVAAVDQDDLAVVEELHAFQTSLGLDSRRVSGREARGLVPLLAAGVRGALVAAGDHQVDGRRLVRALLAAAEASGVVVYRRAVAEVVTAGGRVRGVALANGAELAAPTVVLAAGCWSADVAGLPDGVAPPVRPVGGQILRLRIPEGFAAGLPMTVRGLARGHSVYLVPRADGELVVGATVEELGFDTRVTAGGVYELLRDARAVVPAVMEWPLEETHAGFRPGTPDNAPLIGASGLDGLVLATGHYRNGVLLAPVTADAVAELLVTGDLPEVAAAFRPDRPPVATGGAAPPGAGAQAGPAVGAGGGGGR